jgi:hypothetical protein
MANALLWGSLQLKVIGLQGSLHVFFFFCFSFVLENIGTLSGVFFFCYSGAALELVCISAFWTFDLTCFFLCFFFYFSAQTLSSILSATFSLYLFICYNANLVFIFFVAVIYQHLLVIGWGLLCRASHSLFWLARTHLFLHTVFLIFIPLPFSPL